MQKRDLKTNNLPDTPGVYYFQKGKKVLYVGKATSLRDRVKSYFTRDILMTRSPLIAKMLEEADKVEFVETDSVLEALILEANEIKKLQPYYNSKEKDDKSYNYITLTKEDFPKVTITRGSGTFGPYPHGSELKEALKIVRKIFPYRDEKCKLVGRPCFNAQIGLCPGPCAGLISKTDYGKIVRHLKLFFQGKKDILIRNLEREMAKLAKEEKFEEAEKVKRKIFALNHIQDIALIREDISSPSTTLGAIRSTRIEAYDIAHISGTNAVGVMVVVVDGKLDKSQYRKFKIRDDKNNDTKNLKEVLGRRLAHPEWRYPDLIVVDGGKAQINAAKTVLEEAGLEFIKVVSVVKDEHHRAREVLNLGKKSLEKQILLANAEAHRFAIKYHRLLRSKGFRI